MDKLYPGKYEAIEESMAAAIEDQMKKLFEEVKKTNIPDIGKEDRKILFVAIARGILQYLNDNQNLINITFKFQGPASNQPIEITANVNMNIDMDKRR